MPQLPSTCLPDYEGRTSFLSWHSKGSKGPHNVLYLTAILLLSTIYPKVLKMASSLPPGVSLDMIPSTPPPLGVVPNFVNPVSLAHPIVAVSVITSVLAVILVFIRLCSTLRITRSASYDDGACVLALVFSLAYIGLVVSTNDHARHGWDIPLSAFTASYLKIILAETIIGAFALVCSKTSIFLLLFRLFSPTPRFRHLVYIGIIWTAVVGLASIIIAGALCAPRHGEFFSSLTVAERCSHESILAVTQGTLYMLLDFYMFYLPIPMVMKLQMGRKRKIGVLAIFMTGLIACAASTASLVYKIKLFRSNDTLWNGYIVDVLNIVELNVTIMVACMPACASFSRHFLYKYEIISSIKSRLFASRSSKKGPSGPETSTTAPSALTIDPRLRGKYWRIKNAFSNGDRAPHITRNQQQSRMLRTGELDVVDNGNPSMSTHQTRRGDNELKEPSFGGEKWAPDYIV
ncbi:hypothetical protein N7G274_009315 [Stereocaulon virgatum]|uniref:Rhodopsin domain-containing protein n=1 Tax=Stereocaulon virgatum TaxID=373712 RepID=A0ABR3ZXZ0_9LECA